MNYFIDYIIMNIIIIIMNIIIDNNYKQCSLPKPRGRNVLQVLGSALEGVGLRIVMGLIFWEHPNHGVNPSKVC